MSRAILLASAAMASAVPAMAQPAAAPAASAEQGVGEIVVTASRRSESQQKVPIAISAFKGETLATLGIRNTVDLPQLTPGLTFIRTLGGVNAYLRGIGNSSSCYTTEPPVATYVDGIYLPIGDRAQRPLRPRSAAHLWRDLALQILSVTGRGVVKTASSDDPTIKDAPLRTLDYIRA